MASTVDAARVAEHHEPGDVLSSKLDKLMELIRGSRYTVFYTGAGVSTSAGVGDYRGPSGAWTERRIVQLRSDTSESGRRELKRLLEEKAKEKKKCNAGVNTLDALPAYNHMAVAKLIEKGLAHYVVTTNLDGIYRKAGLKAHSQVCFLHGDIYTERCTACKYEFERNYEVRRRGVHVHDHFVGVCEKCGSGPPQGYTGRPLQGETGSGLHFRTTGLVGTRDINSGTKDTHINFGEVLDTVDWREADKHCKKADLCVVMGTSMSLRHITHFPFLAKKTVIINLQATPDDAQCDLRIWATCDTAMQGVMRRLGFDIDEIPVWRPRDALPIAELRRRGVWEPYVAAAERLEEFTRSQEQFHSGVAERDDGPPSPSAPPPPTEITLRNEVSARGEDGLIPWSVTVEDTHSAIEYVVFKLHPTFTPNTITLHSAPFSVARRGWGEFTIEITLYLNSGGVRTVKHHLNLSETTAKRVSL